MPFHIYIPTHIGAALEPRDKKTPSTDVGKDNFMMHLHILALKGKAGYAAATDGRMLALVRCQHDDVVKPMWLPPVHGDLVAKRPNRNAEHELHLIEDGDGKFFYEGGPLKNRRRLPSPDLPPRVQFCDVLTPPTDLMSLSQNEVVEVAISPTRLAMLAEALGTPDSVVLLIDKSTKPLTVLRAHGDARKVEVQSGAVGMLTQYWHDDTMLDHYRGPTKSLAHQKDQLVATALNPKLLKQVASALSSTDICTLLIGWSHDPIMVLSPRQDRTVDSCAVGSIMPIPLSGPVIDHCRTVVSEFKSASMGARIASPPKPTMA